jgi:fructose-specific component phosphotransferase system IIB-like protein
MMPETRDWLLIFNCISTGESMSNIARIGSLLIVAAMVLLTVPIAAAEATPEPHAAPIPTQIFTGKKVFISNSESPIDSILEAPNLTYNNFYAQIKNWGKYELVSTPAEADLVFEIGSVILPGRVFNGDSSPKLQARLTVLDLKTHVVLWTFVEPVELWIRTSTGRKNFDQAMTKLVDDLKKLTSTPEAPAANK